jgi:hypothetical protein
MVLFCSVCDHEGAGPCAVAALLLLGDVEEARTRAEALLTGQQFLFPLALDNPSSPFSHGVCSIDTSETEAGTRCILFESGQLVRHRAQVTNTSKSVGFSLCESKPNIANCEHPTNLNNPNCLSLNNPFHVFVMTPVPYSLAIIVAIVICVSSVSDTHHS